MELDDLEVEILSRLVAGEAVVSRIVTMQWFTYEIDGESCVVGPEMQLRFEQLAGTKLCEFTPPKYALERALGFRACGLPRVRQALAAHGIAIAQVANTDQKGRS